jgi:CheY-like chemotaxis protein
MITKGGLNAVIKSLAIEYAREGIRFNAVAHRTITGGVRHNLPCEAIPIVFITAHGDTTIRPRLLALGATECLFKPFTEDALLEALTKALGTR